MLPVQCPVTQEQSRDKCYRYNVMSPLYSSCSLLNACLLLFDGIEIYRNDSLTERTQNWIYKLHINRFDSVEISYVCGSNIFYVWLKRIFNGHIMYFPSNKHNDVCGSSIFSISGSKMVTWFSPMHKEVNKQCFIDRIKFGFYCVL